MRWLIGILGLAAALIAGFSLLGGFEREPTTSSGETPDLHRDHGFHDEIDEESRERLRAILRGAEGEEDADR